MGNRSIPAGCQFWPANPVAGHQPAEIVQMYAEGFAGAWADEAAKRQLAVTISDAGGMPFAHQACRAFAGSGAGKLSLLFPAVEQLFPGALPGPAQERGDCVSHSSKNAALASLANEIVSGKPDEVTGWYEAAPELSAAGIKNGVLSSEYLYWFRGYNDDGWDCATAADKICTNGMLLRQPYPELGIDLSVYSGKLAGQYGAKAPPATITQAGQVHLVRTVTEVKTLEELRDLIANGYGVSSCGSEGFADTRDQNGVASRSGSWAHAMAYLGVDDRAETKQTYGDALVLVMNSWGQWNKGGRRIAGTQLDIPHGSFWAKWRDVARRYAMAYSSVAGWPKKTLPDYGVSIAG